MNEETNNVSISEYENNLPAIIEQLEFCGYKTADGLHDLKMNAAFIALKKMAQRDEVDGLKCGQGIKFGHLLVGCGRAINSSREVYRCYDCDNAFHKNCLKQHCREQKHGENK